jgi:hypothetical protein
MARYIKKFSRVGSLGPTEERGFALWVGYELEGVDADLDSAGLVKVDGWSEDELARHGVTSFTHVPRDNAPMRAKLGVFVHLEEQ